MALSFIYTGQNSQKAFQTAERIFFFSNTGSCHNYHGFGFGRLIFFQAIHRCSDNRGRHHRCHIHRHGQNNGLCTPILQSRRQNASRAQHDLIFGANGSGFGTYRECLGHNRKDDGRYKSLDGLRKIYVRDSETSLGV